MLVRVKLFATLGSHMADVPPGTPVSVELPDEATVRDLIDALGLPPAEVRMVFVNGRARPEHHVLEHGDEIGIFPPVGGG